MGYRGIILLIVFLVVDCALILWVNTPVSAGVAAPISSVDQMNITYALVGAAVIAILGAILFKSKPVPARFR